MTIKAKARAIWTLLLSLCFLAVFSTLVLAADMLAPSMIKDVSRDLADMEAQQLLAYIAIVSVLGIVATIYSMGRFFLPMRLEMVRVSERLSELIHTLQNKGEGIETSRGE